MNDKKIILLDTNTANKIAAGEVVEKPASVIKELLENSLDAEAKTIEIEIAEGGTTYLRVTDDGVGMSPEDAQKAVLRHATSKIRTNEDLMFVKTFGFRGEALPSIASVSKFTLITRESSSDLATKVSISGGQDLDVIETGANIGTTIIVEDIFYNVPARKKFLRTNNTEGRYINDIVGKLALSCPNVKFILTNNGRQVVNTPGNGSLSDTIAALYGVKTKDDILEINYEKDGVKIYGYIGKPSLLKSSRQWQTIFVNGRVISSRFISRAIDHAYQSQLPKRGYPFAVVKIVVDTTQTDVNVHPQKSEIKFGDEQKIYRAVYNSLFNTLQTPLINLRSEEKPETFKYENSYLNNIIDGNERSIDGSHYYKESFNNNAYKVLDNAFTYNNNKYDEDSKKQFSIARDEIISENASKSDDIDIFYEENTSNTDNVIWPLGQIDRMYIIAQSENSLYLIDQHAAHERIIFDRLSSDKNIVPSQNLLVPLFVELSNSDIDLAIEFKTVFSDLSFDIEEVGPGMLRLNSVPADIDLTDLTGFIQEILKYIVEMKKPSHAEIRKEIIAMTSCKAAIKAGQTLNIREMRKLIDDLMKTNHPFTCPHGRPIIITYSSEDLFRMFKRT